LPAPFDSRSKVYVSARSSGSVVVSSGYRLADPRFAPVIRRSASPFGSACDLRRLPIFRLCLPTQPPPLIGVRLLTCLPVNLQLALAINFSGLAIRSSVDLRLRSIFRLRLPICLRLLAPPASLPAPFRLASSLRLRSVFQLTFRPPSSLRFRPTFRFRLRT